MEDVKKQINLVSSFSGTFQNVEITNLKFLFFLQT